MLLSATDKIYDALGSFITAYYPAGGGATPLDVSLAEYYIEPDFDPAEEKQYEKLAGIKTIGFVIFEPKIDKSRLESPPTFQHNTYQWKIAIIRKSNKDRNTSRPNKNAVFSGDISPVTLTSLASIAQNLDKYLDNHKLGGEVYTSRVTNIDYQQRHTYDGQYFYIVLQYEGYQVETNTITA